MFLGVRHPRSTRLNQADLSDAPAHEITSPALSNQGAGPMKPAVGQVKWLVAALAIRRSHCQRYARPLHPTTQTWSDRELRPHQAKLDNYANTLTLTGRHSEALEASEQALEHYRAARDNNPSLDNDVARVLSNYCQRLAATGRFIEAAAAGADAITLFEQLSAANPRNEVYAATTRARRCDVHRRRRKHKRGCAFGGSGCPPG